MYQLRRACTALALTLLAATALGAAGSAGLAHTRTPAGEHGIVQADGRTEVNNTGSSYNPPGAKM
ncbi:hypothetical protein [Streptomyces sp. NPDC046759]|uniref:hypothetical protein n=1 Tax=Streptomyces sp. NPDC046759 TaxID=3155019 RepID=UPI0033DD7130